MRRYHLYLAALFLFVLSASANAFAPPISDGVTEAFARMESAANGIWFDQHQGMVQLAANQLPLAVGIPAGGTPPPPPGSHANQGAYIGCSITKGSVQGYLNQAGNHQLFWHITTTGGSFLAGYDSGSGVPSSTVNANATSTTSYSTGSNTITVNSTTGVSTTPSTYVTDDGTVFTPNDQVTGVGANTLTLAQKPRASGSTAHTIVVGAYGFPFWKGTSTQIPSLAYPNGFYWNAINAPGLGSGGASNGTAGIIAQYNTTTTASATAGATTLQIASANNINNNTSIDVALHSGAVLHTFVSSGGGTTTIVIHDAVPGGDSVNSGATVTVRGGMLSQHPTVSFVWVEICESVQAGATNYADVTTMMNHILSDAFPSVPLANVYVSGIVAFTKTDGSTNDCGFCPITSTPSTTDCKGQTDTQGNVLVAASQAGWAGQVVTDKSVVLGPLPLSYTRTPTLTGTFTNGSKSITSVSSTSDFAELQNSINTNGSGVFNTIENAPTGASGVINATSAGTSTLTMSNAFTGTTGSGSFDVWSGELTASKCDPAQAGQNRLGTEMTSFFDPLFSQIETNYKRALAGLDQNVNRRMEMARLRVENALAANDNLSMERARHRVGMGP